MTLVTYLSLRDEIIRRGFQRDIDWAESVGPPTTALNFFAEYGWVVVNSGMSNKVATKIWQKIVDALKDGRPLTDAFKNKTKIRALLYVWENQHKLFETYLQLKTIEEQLEFFKSLPWIGDITKYHLAKNYGLDFCKPDRHLVRISAQYQTTPEMLCQRLSTATGDRIGTVDYVLWRAASLRLL